MKNLARVRANSESELRISAFTICCVDGRKDLRIHAPCLFPPGRSPSRTVFATADSAIFEMCLRREQKPGRRFIWFHESGLHQYNAGLVLDVAQQGEYVLLICQRPLGQGTRIHGGYVSGWNISHADGVYQFSSDDTKVKE